MADAKEAGMKVAFTDTALVSRHAISESPFNQQQDFLTNGLSAEELIKRRTQAQAQHAAERTAAPPPPPPHKK